MKLKIFLPAIVLLLSSSAIRAVEKNIVLISGHYGKNPATSISVKLLPKTALIFNGFVYTSQYLKFENHSNRDTVISKQINIDRPTILFYLEGKIQNGKFENNFESLLLLPGDSIVVDNENKHILFSTGINSFVDKIITIPYECYPVPQKGLKANSMESLKRIFSNFDSNLHVINQLNIANPYKDALNKLNEIIKFQQISLIPIKKLSADELRRRDGLNEEMFLASEKINSINVSFKELIFSNIISSNVFKKDKNTDLSNLWDYFDKVDDSIKKAPFYKDYLISGLLGTFKYTPELLHKIDLQLSPLKKSDNSVIDTLKPLIKYLLQTFSDFKEAKQNLNSFNNGKYAFIVNNEAEANHEIRYIKNLATTYIIDLNNHISTLQELLKDPKAKLYVIDVWAHWCIPCIKESKALKKIQSQFKDAPIVFISLSIDKEADSQLWRKMLKDLMGIATKDQYLLQDAEHSPFRSYFNIESIPSFIVIDNTGKILNDNFSKPSSGEFEIKLKSYL